MSTKKESGRQETLGERLRKLRKAKGFTQSELAQAIGSSQRMITYYERHDGIPAAPMLLRLAEVLGTTPEEVLGLQRPRRKAELDSPENIRLWRKLRQVEKLSPAERRQVLQLIEALVERSELKRQKAS